MKVVVVGGTGFIGPDVVRRIYDSGHEVTVIHSGAHEADGPAVQHVHIPFERLVDARVAADVVIGMALMTESQARTFSDAFGGSVDRAVVISSSDVYRAYGRLHGTEPGPPESMPLGDDAPLRERLFVYRERAPSAAPREPWLDDYEKILVERVARDELRATILRLGMVFGPRSHRFYPYLRRMDDGRRAIVLGAAWAAFRGTRAYVTDVAAAIGLATERASPGRTYNVGLPVPTVEADLVRDLARIAAWDGEVVAVPAERLPPKLAEEVEIPAGGHDLVLDTTRIRAELRYEERTSWEDALRRAVEWMRANPKDVDYSSIYATEDQVLTAV